MKLTCRKCGIKEDENEFDSINTTTQAGTCLRCANLQSTERNYGGNKAGIITGNQLNSLENGGDMNDKTKLADALKRHKEKTGVAWEDMAHDIGVRAKTIWRLINQPDAKMNQSTLKLVANYLKDNRNGHAK